MRLVLIRGLPGSGKSTFANLIANNLGFEHYEYDMFFVVNGEYRFDATRVLDAHAWCQHNVEAVLKKGRDVIVSNTFTRVWEMQHYLDLGEEYNAKIIVLTMEGNHGNVHGVPPEVIKKMRQRWEQYRP